jgi:hypothetical protein
MSDEGTQAGTRFPFINLEKALGRAEELYKADQKGREMAVAAAFATWSYSEKSSGGFQTISALKEYGLLAAPGTGKVQLTAEALRYFREEREEERERLRMYFAHRPKLIQTIWLKSNWGATPPADSIARSHLKTDIGLSEQSARSFLAIYKENIAFAGFKGDDKVHAHAGGKAEEVKTPKVPPHVEIGDYIQWTSNGVDQFGKPARVVWLSEDGSHLRVHGSLTGVPVSEVTVVEAPSAAQGAGIAIPKSASSAYAGQDGDLSVLLKGNRLEITADVGLAGIERLKEILGKYEEILKLLEPSVKQ